MKILERHIGEKIITQNLIIFYAVGLFLYYIPFTKDIFYFVLPVQLLLVNGIILYHHKGYNARTILTFIFIFASSWFVEFLGVQNENIFGKYLYLNSLGIKIFDVPVLIGLNWLMLVYASNAIMKNYTDSMAIRIISASLIMVIYDFIVEFIASDLRMWKFSGDFPPLRNFVSWFVLAFIFNTLVEIFKVNTNNKAARILIFIQFVFFLSILVINFILKL